MRKLCLAAVALVLGSTGIGCNSDQGLKERNNGISQFTEADIEVSREEIDFGAMAAGEAVTENVTVTNVGTEGSELNVTALDLAGDGGGTFAILEAPELPVALRRNESFDFVAQFTAGEPQEEYGEIVVSSDDEDEKETYVSLLGKGLAAKLVIEPDPLDFGATTIGCPAIDGEFVLRNDGNLDLRIDEIVSRSTYNEFDIVTRPTFPLVIEPGNTAALQMVFDPGISGALEGEIEATSNDPRGTVTARQIGSARPVGNNSDLYTVPSVGKLDILFAVDQSNSMESVRTRLGEQAAAIATRMGTITDDWRVGVVTADSGCLVGGVMDKNTADFAQKFVAAVQTGSESESGYALTEALIYLAAKVVEQSGNGQCNGPTVTPEGVVIEGFPRKDALYHVIPISDEIHDEFRDAPYDWRTSLDKMIQHQDAGYLVKVSPVVKPDYAGDYELAALATYGTMTDIMDTWQVDTVAATEIHRSTFPVLGNPDVATIRVYLNGAMVATGWQYREELHSVVFYEQIPYTGDTVEIVYQVPPECPTTDGAAMAPEEDGSSDDAEMSEAT